MDSGGVALVAVASDREIGVDVEAVRPERDPERIATRFFSVVEVAALLAEPPKERPAAFFRCWTRKEAYIKAVGDGLAIPLDSFDVAFDLKTPARLLANRLAPDEVERWSMAALDPGPGSAAAMVVEGKRWSGRYFEGELLSSFAHAQDDNDDGNVKLTVVPRPTSLVAAMSPPWATTRFRAIARPRPAPRESGDL